MFFFYLNNVLKNRIIYENKREKVSPYNENLLTLKT